MLTIPTGWSMPLQAHLGPLLAAVVALAGGWLCRAKTRSAYLPALASLAALVGWAAPLPRDAWARLATTPHGGPAVLLVPALAIAVVAAVGVRTGGRLGRWLPALAAAFAGWWLARWAAPAAEFWRVWLAVLVAAFVLARLSSRQPERGLASALTLWGGLLVGGGGGWTMAAEVVVAVYAGLLVTAAEAGLPVPALALLLVGADLAGGRALRGHVNSVDLACILAFGTPWLAGRWSTGFGRRFGVAGPAAGAVAASGAATGLLWLLHRGSFT